MLLLGVPRWPGCMVSHAVGPPRSSSSAFASKQNVVFLPSALHRANRIRHCTSRTLSRCYHAVASSVSPRCVLCHSPMWCACGCRYGAADGIVLPWPGALTCGVVSHLSAPCCPQHLPDPFPTVAALCTQFSGLGAVVSVNPSAGGKFDLVSAHWRWPDSGGVGCPENETPNMLAAPGGVM